MSTCGPCLGQNARYVGVTGLYGLGVANPAPGACTKAGGKYVPGSTVDTGRYEASGKPIYTQTPDACVFPDGTSCNPFAVLRGECGPRDAPTYDYKRDLLSAGLAFGLPTLYHYKAPKKWKRPGRLGSVAAVVGVYFLSSFIYGKVVNG